MTDELKPCPFCGSPARLNRSTGESLWSHDQVEWTQVQCTNEDCGVATENHCEGWEPTPIESWNSRALSASQPAQAGEAVDRGHLFDLRYALDVLHKVRCMVSDQDAAHGELGAAITGMRYVIDRTERTTAPLPTQPAAQATPEGMKVYDGIAAGCFADTKQATPEPVGEVFYAADGGDDETGAGYYMKPCVRWIGKAPEAGTNLFTHPAPGVPDGEPKLTQEELLEVAKHAWLMARTADSLQFYRTLLSAAAQAKGDAHD